MFQRIGQVFLVVMICIGLAVLATDVTGGGSSQAGSASSNASWAVSRQTAKPIETPRVPYTTPQYTPNRTKTTPSPMTTPRLVTVAPHPTIRPTQRVIYATPEPTPRVVYVTPKPTVAVIYVTPEPTQQVIYVTPEPTPRIVYVTPEPTVTVIYATPEPTKEPVVATPEPTIAPTELPVEQVDNDYDRIDRELSTLVMMGGIYPDKEITPAYDLYDYLSIREWNSKELFEHLIVPFEQGIVRWIHWQCDDSLSGTAALQYALNASVDPMCGRVILDNNESNVQEFLTICEEIRQSSDFENANWVMSEFLYQYTTKNPYNPNERLFLTCDGIH